MDGDTYVNTWPHGRSCSLRAESDGLPAPGGAPHGAVQLLVRGIGGREVHSTGGGH